MTPKERAECSKAFDVYWLRTKLTNKPLEASCFLAWREAWDQAKAEAEADREDQCVERATVWLVATISQFMGAYRPVDAGSAWAATKINRLSQLLEAAIRNLPAESEEVLPDAPLDDDMDREDG